MGPKKKDPTVTSEMAGPEYPEGTHPARPVAETEFSADKLKYSDMPDADKPDPSSIVQLAEVPENWPGQ